MEPGPIIAGVAVVNLFITIGTAIYAYTAKRKQATQDQIAGVRADMAGEIKLVNDRAGQHAERIMRLEESVDSLPSSQSIHELALAVERTNGDLRAVTARLEGWEGATRRIEAVMNRQEEFLLNLGRGK